MTVTDDAFSELQQQLGDIPPDTLARLSPEQLRDLAGAIQAARRRQAAELAAAGEKAFKHIPRLLRGPIRKLLR
jgi:hypothetical protein